MRMIALSAVLVVSALSLNGCIMPHQPTAEEMEMRQKLMQGFLNRMGQPQEAQAKQAAKIEQAPAVSEQDLAAQIAAFPELPGGATIVKKKDGFEANGRRHIDPEGQIVKYGSSARTGDVTYMAQLSEDSYAIKTMRVGSEPITIATANVTATGWSVVTATGKKLTGEAIIPLSRGFLVGRSTAGFLYTPGKGITSIAVPDGFLIAPFQNGDIVGTRYLLVERQDIDKSDQVGGIMNAVSSLGSTLGINKKEDYILLHMDSGKQVPINVSMDDKKEGDYSQCRRKGAVMNACKKVEFFESLYDKYGMPNGGHYYWRISWQKSDSGPLLIITENSMRETTVENLATGKKTPLFNRLLGINYVIVTEKPDGRIAATAKLGFDTQTIDDVEQALNKVTTAAQ